jgi:hypothetical protein
VAGGEAAPDNATVQLDAATHLALKGMSHTTAQANRVKKSYRDEAREELIVPPGDLTSDAE